jgi:uncharacterized protein YbjT (DUF2867 family)
MNRSDKTILVTGGTGHQGGGVARHVLADGWKVRALVRDPNKPAAAALAAAGAELFVGDLNDRASVDEAVAGTYGVYSVQSLAEGPEAELRQSKNLADAAKTAGVQHFVYSSVNGADRDSDLPWVTNKVAMERYLRSLELPLTVFRPVTFMENMLGQKESLAAGTLTGFDAPDAPHLWIAADDIGRFVALAFLQPETWLGTATELAGDDPTGIQAAAAFSLALGHPIAYEQLPPPPGMPAPTPPAPGDPAPRRADMAKLRESIPDLLTLVEWATEQRRAGVL